MKEISALITTAIFVLLLNACSEQPAPEIKLEPVDTPEATYKKITINEDTSQWWKNTIFYQIWPRSFYDSDGDGSGDFNGMTAKLDYLEDLGVNGIWLTPIFEAPSYHGYDFQDLYKVESDYGSMADFENFMRECKERDIKVILDLVINHISDGHEWFLKSAAREKGYEDYFVWRKEKPKHWGKAWSDTIDDPDAVWHWNETRQEYYYGAFGATQPDVNLESPAVVKEMNDMATFWLEKGADGFRLDAVRYALEDVSDDGHDAVQADTDSTIAYWRQFTEHVTSVNPEALLVAEAWTDMKTLGRYYDNGKGMQSAFDFDFGYVVTQILNGGGERTADFGTVDDSSSDTSREALWKNLTSRIENAPISFYSPFLTNHDQNRIMYSLGEDWDKAKVAASLLFTTPGPLYVYYGEEIGLSQYTTGDDQFRRAIMQWQDSDTAGFNETGEFWMDQAKWFPWMEQHQPWWEAYWQSQRGSKLAAVDVQLADPNSLLNHYRKLIEIRNNEVAFQFPDEIRYYPVDNEKVWVVKNIKGNQQRITIVNLSVTEEATFTVPAELQGIYNEQLSAEELKVERVLTLAPASTLIL